VSVTDGIGQTPYSFEHYLVRNKIKWHLRKKFKNSLNGHNSSCTQDRVVIFGSVVWFSWSANLMASFTPGWPMLPWQQNLRQIGYNSARKRDMSEILAPSSGFSRSGYYMMSDKSYHDRPRCHGN